MTHLTECPACRHELQVPPELLGQLVKCPMCAKTFTAPATFVDASSQNVGTPPPPPPQPAYAETQEAYTPPPRSRSSSGFRCRYCESTARPRTQNQISVAGWIVFAVMLVFCFPLFWIGLLMTEDVKTCSDCGRKLSDSGF
jgi:lipopolysaccharide-induced tumor necrosis factor-alpha factor